jgi:hypothetical protein
MKHVAEFDFSGFTNAIWGARRSEEKFFAMIAPLLSSYLDESADQKKKEALCIAGILIREDNLARIQEQWIERLRVAGIPYFHYTECKGLHGEFFSYRRKYGTEAHQRADAVLEDLEGILLSASWGGFSAGVLVSEYMGILHDIPASKHIFREDPTEALYGQMLYEIARQVRRNAKGFQVAYFIDESSDFSKIYDMFEGTKANHPVIGRTMKTIAPLDDKDVPALQMADLFTGRIREGFIAWLKSGRPDNPIMDAKWNKHIEPTWIWDREHMIRLIKTTLKSPKLKDGTIAVRLLNKPSAADLRRQEKARRKQITRGRT